MTEIEKAEAFAKEEICFLCTVSENKEIICKNCFCTKMIDALKEKAERSNPKPLTLEELKQMNGESVYIVFPLNAEKCGWRLVEGYSLKCISFRGDYSLYIADYNKTWLAYRYKPKEVQHE